MPRHLKVTVGDGRTWAVGSILEWGSGDGEVIVPLDAIDGMTNEEIGAAVVALTDEARLIVALDVAESILSRPRVQFDDDDFQQCITILEYSEGSNERVDRALGRMQGVYDNEMRRVRQRGGTSTGAGYIYVIKSGPYFKIGMTKHLDKRIQALAIQLPEKVTVVLTVHVWDMRRDEQRLHERFKAKRLNGEWFALTQDDISAIAEIYSDK